MASGHERYGRTPGGGREGVLECEPRDGWDRELFVILREPLTRAISALHFCNKKIRSFVGKAVKLLFYHCP